MALNPFIAVRVPPDVIKSLDEVAAKRGITRPALIKELLANCHSFYRFIEAERERQKVDLSQLDGDLTKWFLDNMPKTMTPQWVNFLGETMHHVAEKMSEQEKSKPSKPKRG